MTRCESVTYMQTLTLHQWHRLMCVCYKAVSILSLLTPTFLINTLNKEHVPQLWPPHSKNHTTWIKVEVDPIKVCVYPFNSYIKVLYFLSAWTYCPVIFLTATAFSKECITLLSKKTFRSLRLWRIRNGVNWEIKLLF